MNSQELKFKLKSVGISQIKFSALCGVSEVQVSKWVNGHSDVPEYAKTILNLTEENKEKDSLEKLTNLANVVSDGHFTLCKFTTNYRVGLGTPSERASIDKMLDGKTVSEAIGNLLRKIDTAASID